MLFDHKESKFENMVRAYSADLYRFTYWLCRDRNLAEDLVQETFARAWNAWHTLKNEKTVKSWLFTIARNEHARLYERKHIEIDSEQELDNVLASYQSNIQSNIEMEQLLRTLPQSYREPLLLQILGGFSCAEIGTMLALTEGTVMTRLTRARQALRKLIQSDSKWMEQENGLS